MIGILGTITYLAGVGNTSNYAYADGSLVSIEQNTSLFQLLGTLYGGDGSTTFGLPNYGRIAVQGASGDRSRDLPMGQRKTISSITMGPENTPEHTHNMTFKYANAPATQSIPSPGCMLAAGSDNENCTNTMYGTYSGSNPHRFKDATLLIGEATNSTNGASYKADPPAYLAVRALICTYGQFPELF